MTTFFKPISLLYNVFSIFKRMYLPIVIKNEDSPKINKKTILEYGNSLKKKIIPIEKSRLTAEHLIIVKNSSKINTFLFILYILEDWNTIIQTGIVTIPKNKYPFISGIPE